MKERWHFQITCLIPILLLISGCVAATVHPATYVVKSIPRHDLQPKAEAGDPSAQYELGKSWCCMGPGFDTQTATEWLCKAARQNHVDAMYELGSIYYGNVSRTPVPGQKIRRFLLPKKSTAHAHLWLDKAANADHEKASRLLNKLSRTMDAGDYEVAVALAADWHAVPCEYDQVFPL